MNDIKGETFENCESENGGEDSKQALLNPVLKKNALERPRRGRKPGTKKSVEEEDSESEDEEIANPVVKKKPQLLFSTVRQDQSDLPAMQPTAIFNVVTSFHKQH
jgi:hypothetical protein